MAAGPTTLEDLEKVPEIEAMGIASTTLTNYLSSTKGAVTRTLVSKTYIYHAFDCDPTILKNKINDLGPGKFIEVVVTILTDYGPLNIQEILQRLDTMELKISKSALRNYLDQTEGRVISSSVKGVAIYYLRGCEQETIDNKFAELAAKKKSNRTGN
jgi:predicted DNA-binding protein (UPF0251 family)